MTAATSGGSGAKPPQWEADDAATLAKNELLARLAGPERATFTETLDQVAVTRGTELLHEGDPGEYMYFVLEGSLFVRRGGVEIRKIGPGDHFGEMALIDDSARRSATVVAVTPVQVAYIARHHFDALLAANPSVREGVQRTLRERSLAPETDEEFPRRTS